MDELEQKPPKIEFPCEYPIKVIVEMEEGLLDRVVEIVKRHDPTLLNDQVTERVSSKGNYSAFTIRMQATGEAQLQRLFEDLKECDAVRMVL